MKGISEKISRKIVAFMLAVVMVVGVVAGAGILTGRPLADEIGKFDPVFYAQAYPDVAAVLGTDANVLYNHYVTCGQAEGRVPYAGAVAGETVEGIADTADSVTDTTVAVQTPVSADIGDGPFYLTFGGEVDKATFLQKKQELQPIFDASDYAKVGWTEEQVYDRLMWIKANLYPEGTKVGICQKGADKIRSALYGNGWNFSVGTDEHGDWYYVDGFVTSVAKSTVYDGSIKSLIRVGDMLYTTGYKRLGHVQIVLSRDEYGIKVVESNLNDDEKMHWGRRITWEELERRGSQDWCGTVWQFQY